ncbi:fos transcription factor-related [Clonorchis sinensis]|uniref:Fos transcription factor-related n=1 Tax=Clonorchis sinensis TaxID=79923 RepID=G7YHQ4_CLOSI|nr:fos transcription factor-related [Clonorchis sinensis]
MSEAGENMDAATALGSSIHLNEDDWLQLLQKLTPSSIDNLQQTLKRIQQRESPILSPEKLNFLGTASQLCGSSLLSPTISESSVLNNQNAPLVMSLGVSKAAVPSVITVPSVLNVSKTMPTQLQSTIVLPSTALLIAPSGHSQPISLDSRVPVSGVNRLLFTTGGLPVMSTASSTSIASTSDTFNSLNTLANAAVAVAANASGQTPWSSDLLSTAKTNSIDSAPIPPTSTASDTQLRLGSAAATLATRATLDGLLTSLCGSPSAELPTNLLSTNVGTAAGLTVYPIQVSANGPTVFIAAPKNQSPQGLNILGANTLQLATGQSLVQCLSSNAISSNSVPTSCTTPVSPSTLLSINPAPLNSSQTLTAIASSPLSTSTPRNKPKFKALWENSAQGEGDRSSVGNNSDSLSSAESTPARPSSSTDVFTSCAIPVTNQCTLMRPNNTTATRRQSPMLNVKSIGQTPKRLAATAASLTDEQNSFGQEGPKKLLLVCSQPKQQSATQSSTDSGISLASAESLLTRVLHARTLAGTVVSRVEPEISWTAVSLNPTNSSTDPKTVVVPSQPLLAPASVFVNDLRSTVCSSNNNVPSSDHDMSSAALGSRVESVVSKSFDGSRRLIKEESVGEDEARRRAKRRERNRVAAARCRQRRQDQIVELQHRVGVLTKTGEELRTSLQTLEHERTRLEGLIRQHGLAGCVEAEELLSRMALERSELSMHDNVASVSTPVAHLKSDDLVPNLSSTTTPTGPISPSVILVTNTLVTKPEPDCNEVTLTSIRPSLAKLDLRRQTQPTCAPNVVISAISASNCLGGSKLNSEPSSRADDFGTSNSSTVYRLAARPSTLIPDRLLTEVTQLADKALGGNTTGASTTTTTTTATSTTISGTSIEIPTPGFWPSDLQTFSPILTPSTWRLLKNLTSSTCNTPQSFILTPTLSSACPTISLANMGTPTPAASSSTSVSSSNPFTSVVDSNNDSIKSALTADTVTNSVTTTASSSSTEPVPVPDTGEEAPTSSVTPSDVSDKDGPGVEPDGDSASGDPCVTLGRSLGQTYFLSFSTRCDNAEHGTVTNTTLAN